MKSIKEMVSEGKKAVLISYRQGHLYYKTECGFIFPVPTSEAGEATFHAEERAILLMRYIRKQLEAVAGGQEAITH